MQQRQPRLDPLALERIDLTLENEAKNGNALAGYFLGRVIRIFDCAKFAEPLCQVVR